MRPPIEPLIKLIEKEIDYDANRVQEEIKCQHCGKVVRPEYLSYWIDHRHILAGAIATHLGLRDSDPVNRVLENEAVTGKPVDDAPVLAKAVLDALFV